MPNSKTEKFVEATAEYGGIAAGAAIGGIIGTAIAGPAGSVLGALVGTGLEKAFTWAGKEIRERCLSTSENQKIGTVYELAKNKIEENLKAGKHLRTDEFMECESQSRPAYEELLESTLFAAQRECEEKKLKYIANLYANINFEIPQRWGMNIDSQAANKLMKIVSELSYREIAILAVIGRYQNGSLTKPPRRENIFHNINQQKNYIASEVFDLYCRGLVYSDEIILYAGAMNPQKLNLNGYGAALFNLMELSTMPEDNVVDDVISFMSGIKIVSGDSSKN